MTLWRMFGIFLAFSRVSAEGFQDLGTYGETFPIKEESLLGVIQRKLQSLAGTGALETHQKEIQKNLQARMERPLPVLGISSTTKPRTFTYDPSIRVPYDLKDSYGKVFYQKGKKVNPLTLKTMTKPLLFLDGDDPSHLRWLTAKLSLYPKAKIILVKGSPFTLMEAYPWTFYFDQAGKITTKLGIKQVPAFVRQEGDTLLITEEKPDEV